MANSRELKNIERAVEKINNDQKLKIISMLKTHKRSDIAKEIGISESTLKRIAVHYGFKFSFAKARPYAKYSKELVGEVIKFFEENGISKTKEKYPEVKVRSIIERYPRYKARQKNWTDEEIIQAIKFGPFVSLEDQFRHFNRPLAYEGSVKSLWSKRIKASRSRLHGLPYYLIDGFVTKKAVLHPTKMSLMKGICTWQTLKETLRKDAPEFIKETVEIGYKFHLWIYGENPNKEITKIYMEFNGKKGIFL